MHLQLGINQKLNVENQKQQDFCVSFFSPQFKLFESLFSVTVERMNCILFKISRVGLL